MQNSMRKTQPGQHRKTVTGMPLTLPLLRNGPLPLPALRVRGIWGYLAMHSYFAIVHKDEDSAFGIHFPDIPGCFSAADDIDDVVPRAIEALGLYADDQQLPRPRSMDDLRRDPDVAADLAIGAFLVPVPSPSRHLKRGRPATMVRRFS